MAFDVSQITGGSAARLALAVALALSSFACAAQGTGDYRMAVSTASPEARRHFKRGVVLAWGFNFAEAVRAFRAATRLDPSCALCYWGVAYALGPSINHDMDPRQAAAAYRAVSRASSLAAAASASERALIAALAQRYARNPRAAREPLDRAYAKAMRALAQEHPDDADVLTLAAEAAMDLHPGDYWRSDGTAQPWTAEIVAWLERALVVAPAHAGANHYLIHALEASPEPQRALAAAERLADLAPGVGHLVHVPAHIYLRVGRYHDATLANQRAIAADRAYATAADPAYIEGYARHNVHFLWSSALLEGASALAADTAASLARSVTAASLSGPRGGTAQHFLALPLYTHLRFGKWAAIDATPRPRRAAPYTLGVWHFARGVAAARRADPRAARAELRALEAILRRPALERSEVKSTHSHASLLGIAASLLHAEIAAAQDDPASAVEHARAAVARVDRLQRDEPPTEVAFAARQRLGALLVAAGQFAEASRRRARAR